MTQRITYVRTGATRSYYVHVNGQYAGMVSARANGWYYVNHALGGPVASRAEAAEILARPFLPEPAAPSRFRNQPEPGQHRDTCDRTETQFDVRCRTCLETARTQPDLTPLPLAAAPPRALINLA